MSRPSPLLQDEDERRLVARLRGGDDRAFELFAERYLPALYRFAHRRLNGDRELAREIVQSTVCKVIERLGSYRGEAPFFTWLCACCRNEIAGHYRRLDRRPREVDLEEVALAAVADTHGGSATAAREVEPEERLLRAETAEQVHLALDRLPPSYARAMEWRYCEGVEVAEIARRLEASYKATESLLSRARKAFREAYDEMARGPRLQAAGEGMKR
jgi:RNA polymerase sigma-70 factor (ECF subfamily)